MHQTRLKLRMRAARGLTLIELVVAMVLLAIIVGATIYFLYPVTQAVDIATRAELTDVADNSLQRIGREVRLALPNSVRVTTSGLSQFLEFLPIRTGGRYRADGGGPASGTNCPDTGSGVPSSDQLSFDTVDTCFKTIGALAYDTTITTDDFVVLNNYGAGFTGQDAYATAGTLNRRKIAAAVAEGTRERVSITSATAFDRSLHESPSARFYIVNGNASTSLPEPVTFVCDPIAGTLMRRWGYTMTPAQPTTFAGGFAPALLATDVSNCAFTYLPTTAPQVGLLTLQLELSKVRSDGGLEKVSLYHSVHVSNVP